MPGHIIILYQILLIQANRQMTMPSEKPPAAPSTSALLEAMGYDPIHPDILAQQTNTAAADVYAQLLEYELDGIVAALPGGRYQRIKA